jgi:hypothetical protein
MTVTISLDTSALAGGAQTGLTNPTYDSVEDTYPGGNGKQYAVTALGGTQTGVRTHTVSDPFTIAFVRPQNLRALPQANPITGIRASIPRNQYSVIVRKGVNVAANTPPAIMLLRLTMEVPAGADAYDAVNVRAALSALVGALNDQSSGFGDLSVSGVL